MSTITFTFLDGSEVKIYSYRAGNNKRDGFSNYILQENYFEILYNDGSIEYTFTRNILKIKIALEDDEK